MSQVTWGNAFPILDSDAGNSIVVIEWEHHVVHEGRMFMASHMFEGVVDDASVYILIKVGSSKRLHLVFGVAAGGTTYIYGLKAPDLTGDGTVVTPGNMKDGSVNTLDAEVYHTPSVSGGDYGTQMYVTVIGAGSNKNTAGGGQLRPGLEWELNKDTNYIFQATNKAGSTQDIAVEFALYNEF